MFEECAVFGDFTLSSGRRSNVFYDFDLLLPRETAMYAEQLLQQVPEDLRRRADFVAVPALGGVIPGFLIAFALGRPLLVVDKEGQVRGPDFKVGAYLAVDDVTTSFGQVDRVREALKGRECLAIASYIFRGTREDLGRQDVPVYYLARKEEEI